MARSGHLGKPSVSTPLAELDWSNVSFFSNLDQSVLQQVIQLAHEHQYVAGETIFNEGQRCAGLHIITDGLVRIFRMNSEGRLHTLSLLRSPSSFNEVAAVDGSVNPYNAVAVTQARILVLSHQNLLHLMSTQSAILLNTVKALARLNREYIERLEDMTFRTIPARIAKLFLHEASYADQIAETPSQLTQEEMAAILGTTREVVGRALRNLLNTGLLKKKGRSIYIGDREGLHSLAETNSMPNPSLTMNL